MRSLAAFVNAPLEDVQRYAQTGELRAFFTRTDLPAGHVPKAKMLTEEASKTRWQQAKTRTGHQAQLETMAQRWPENPPEKRATTKPKTGRQRMLETMAARRAQPHKTMAERRAELTRLCHPPYHTMLDWTKTTERG
jgi:hypothetical protein